MASFKCSFLYFVLMVNILVQGSVIFIENNNYENTSKYELHRRYKRNSIGPSREPRFLNFQNLNDSIDIEMQFEVPFLDIPVQRSMNALKKPFVDLNIPSILMMTAIVGGSTAIGSLMGVFKTKEEKPKSNIKNGTLRRESEEDDSFLKNLNYIDQKLINYNIDMTGCTQKLVCGYMKRASNNVQNGFGSWYDKIIFELSDSKWALDLINGTPLELAIKFGREDDTCENSFSNCKFSSNNLISVIRKLFRN